MKKKTKNRKFSKKESLDFFLLEKKRFAHGMRMCNIEPGPIFYLRLCMCADIVMNEIKERKKKMTQKKEIFSLGKILTHSCGIYILCLTIQICTGCLINYSTRTQLRFPC